MHNYKRCLKCHVEKPLTEFSARRSEPNGHQSQCKTCCRAYAAEYYAEHRGKVLAQQTKCRAENSEKIRAADARYRANNLDQVRAGAQPAPDRPTTGPGIATRSAPAKPNTAPRTSTRCVPTVASIMLQIRSALGQSRQKWRPSHRHLLAPVSLTCSFEQILR